MHGRLKVKTTAQQQEEKRKEREKKVKIFTGAMKQIFTQRGNDELMDSTLQLTQQILASNPDVYTLWNIRKEIFVKKLEVVEDIDKLLLEELDFLQNCLQVNPKSYGVWNHRMFTMLKMKTPNWPRELKLCNLFLQYDERNFHCWDYRRFVVRESKVPAEEELNYTTEKIKENFSNYSSWHNRSKLLPQVFPDESGKVKEEELLKEFELVQNAFFTDPNDQSAWFYQRWLLGRRKEETRLLSLIIKRTSRTLVASFSQPVKKCDLCESCSKSGEETLLIWKPLVQTQSNVSHTWVSEIDLQTDKSSMISVVFPTITAGRSFSLEILGGQDSAQLSWEKDFRDESNLFSDTHTEAKTFVLENELEACQILLEEEPDNKWTMLTIVYLMKALDGIKHAEAIAGMIDKLMETDPMRKGYYQHLRSKFNLENKLQTIYNEKESIKELDLSNQGLITVNRLEYLSTCEKLNVSQNNITNFDFIQSLPLLKSVNLSKNNADSSINVEELEAKFPGLIVTV